METVQGMDELLSKLGQLESYVKQGLILRQALRDGAMLIRDEAEHLAPFETGRLQAEMMVTISDASAQEATAKIGPSRRGFYGSFNEFGTANTAAQPFLRPGFDAKVQEATAVIGYKLAEGIEKAAR